MNNPISQKPNILQKILSSRFLLPIIFILLGLSALAITSPFAKADQAGITQIDCIGCVPSLMDQAAGVAVDANGNIFVVESNANRIQKLDSSGNSIIRWGKDGLSGSYGGSVSGGGNGEFNDPNAVATDTAGNVYVADRVNNRIQKFDNDGNFVTKWGSSGIDSYGGSASGTGDGEFTYPEGIAVDNSGNVYVSDSGNHRIQKFSSNGSFITKWGGVNGSGDGEFSFPSSVAVDSSGNIFVADKNNSRIQKLDSNGDFITKWGQSGNGHGEFSEPRGIFIDSDDSVYVADYYNSRIQKFSNDGTFLAKYGSHFENSIGGGNGQFFLVGDSTTDSSGNIYVADIYNHRIQKFDSNGNFITKWGSSNVGPYGGSASGGGNGEFYEPRGIATDASGNVYVSDTTNSRIQKFDSNGNFIAKWGSSQVGSYGGSAESSGNGEFNRPIGIATDASSNVYVADTGNSRIQKFSSDGAFIAKWGTNSGYSGSGNYSFEQPFGITVDANSNVYVSDLGLRRIQKFTSVGTYMSSYTATGRTTAYPLVYNAGIHSAGNGRLYVGTAYSALLTLCDNDVSSNGCLTGASAPNSVTVPNAVNSKPITLSQTGCGAITNASSLSQSAVSKQDGTKSYPVGLLNYTLTGCSNGGSSTVSVVFTGLDSSKDVTLRKYNATTQTYADVAGAVLTKTTLSSEPAVQANFTITDGSSLDQDGQANGVIVDPVGLAVVLGDSSTLANTGVIAISAGILSFILVLSVGLIYIDYRKHKKPLHAVDPTVSYSFAHHMKVVTLPLFRYRIHIKIQKVMPNKNIRRF